MKKLFISQPMRGKSDEEILKESTIMRLISFRSGDLKSHTMIKFAPAQIGGKDNENCSN